MRVVNDRGSCLAVAVVSDDVRSGVGQPATGAWDDAEDWTDVTSPCLHGNVNVLTHDAGSSRLSQGNAGAVTLVEVARFVGAAPSVRAHEPPAFVPRAGRSGRDRVPMVDGLCDLAHSTAVHSRVPL